MSFWDKKEPSMTDRIFAASQSKDPDVTSSLLATNPNLGERSLISGKYGAGANIDELARLEKKCW